MAFEADTIDALKRYLAFIETRVTSAGRVDASAEERSADLRDIKQAVEAARRLVTAHSEPVILIVDDEPAIHQLARRLLEPKHYQVLSVFDAPSALLMLASSPAHVAVCDIHMPGPTGLWLAERIRSGFPSTAIVFATADEHLPGDEIERTGVVGYVLKPFQSERLRQAVAAGVRWSESQSRTAADG